MTPPVHGGTELGLSVGGVCALLLGNLPPCPVPPLLPSLDPDQQCVSQGTRACSGAEPWRRAGQRGTQCATPGVSSPGVPACSGGLAGAWLPLTSGLSLTPCTHLPPSSTAWTCQVGKAPKKKLQASAVCSRQGPHPPSLSVLHYCPPSSLPASHLLLLVCDSGSALPTAPRDGSPGDFLHLYP